MVISMKLVSLLVEMRTIETNHGLINGDMNIDNFNPAFRKNRMTAPGGMLVIYVLELPQPCRRTDLEQHIIMPIL